MLRLSAGCGLLLFAGCGLIPQVGREPLVHNPFPQLSKVAVAPFFNLSTEPTVDGRQFALAYFNELQNVPGFEVVPLGVVEGAMHDFNLSLDSPEDARRLAEQLQVDAIVVGAVTDFSPYYPPRCGLQVEWYAADPSFCVIPPGYGLPWGTPDEERIPASIIFDAKMAMAKARLRRPPGQAIPVDWPEEVPAREAEDDAEATEATAETAAAEPGPPRGPRAQPVMQLTRIYNAHELEFTESLAGYYFFRDDARYGGWQNYLARSDDFIRFCCHSHVREMLTARGGGGESRVVWRWPRNR